MSLASAAVEHSAPENERRLGVHRRIGERRLRLVETPANRRSGPERRAMLDRRETAAGHLRNALQMLTDLLNRDAAGSELDGAVRPALERLWQCLCEVQRLEMTRVYLGRRLRIQEAMPGIDPDQVEILFPPRRLKD
jgi:hypothetical protein